MMSNTLLHLRCYIKELGPVRAYKRKKNKQKLLSKNTEEAINSFVCRELSSEEKRLLSKDMKEKAKRYGFSYEEYFLLHLQGKSEEQVSEYISDFEHVEIVEKMNKAKNQAIFDDKALTYKYFSKYYHRACAFAEPSTRGIECIRAFAEQYGTFILKPIEKASGVGVQVVHGEKSDELQEISKKLLEKYKYGVFVEELIQQVPLMKELHPSSVNTVRIPTIRCSDSETVIFHPFLRVGRGDSVVDNAGAGGIICALDETSGTVIAARDERGNEYTIHPETGIQLLGFKIPQWEHAVETAKQLAQVVPSNRYTGWDLALTDSGWIMVEGNARGQFVWQYSTLEGCRSEINRLFNKMRIKYNRI